MQIWNCIIFQEFNIELSDDDIARVRTEFQRVAELDSLDINPPMRQETLQHLIDNDIDINEVCMLHNSEFRELMMSLF